MNFFWAHAMGMVAIRKVQLTEHHLSPGRTKHFHVFSGPTSSSTIQPPFCLSSGRDTAITLKNTSKNPMSSPKTI
jgi:hypothetical protein